MFVVKLSNRHLVGVALTVDDVLDWRLLLYLILRRALLPLLGIKDFVGVGSACSALQIALLLLLLPKLLLATFLNALHHVMFVVV